MVAFTRLAIAVIALFFTLPLFAQSQARAQSTPLVSVPPPSDTATPEELEQQGDTLRGQKAYLDSIDYYRAAVKKHDSAILHNKIGISYFELLRDREAKKEYQQALHLERDYAEAHNNLGALYYHEGRYGPAIKEYKKAIQLSDLNASFHSNLGTAYFSSKEFDLAVRQYLRAMTLDPDIFDRKAQGGSSIRMVSSTDLAHFHYMMAQMYGQRGDMDRCRYYLSKANEEGYPIRDALRDDQFAPLRKDPNFLSFVRSLKPPSTNE